MKIALCDLLPQLEECEIVVYVGEATNSSPQPTNGDLSITIPGVNGSTWTTSVPVTALTSTMQKIIINVPRTGLVHMVTALMTIQGGIPKSDSEAIKLCS